MELLTEVQDQRTLLLSRDQRLSFKEFDELFNLLFNRTWVVRGKEYNLAELGWKRGYNTRKRSLGLCSYRYQRLFGGYTLKERGTVWISKTYLELNLDNVLDFEDTVRHEIAHAIDCEIRGRSNHDNHWKMICREVGAKPNRVNTEKVLERPKGKYTLKCTSCGDEISKHRRPTRSSSCSPCGNGRYNPEFKHEVIQNW